MKKSLEAKKTQLRSNILQLQVKISERKNLIPKFNEEIMILKVSRKLFENEPKIKCLILSVNFPN